MTCFLHNILILAVTLLILWVGGFIHFLAAIYNPLPHQPNLQTQAIVVLTGGNHRVLTGLNLWGEQSARELFVTGVHKDVTRQELLDYWQSRSNSEPPRCCLTLGYEATTTKGNAQEAKSWIERKGIHTIRLVTSNYHMPRALLEFHAALNDEIKIIPHPVEITDYTPDTQKFWALAVLEYHKILWRRVELILGVELPRKAVAA
ncbi:MAG: YdcF family protein [Alphaproteobacteria bacterium]